MQKSECTQPVIGKDLEYLFKILGERVYISHGNVYNLQADEDSSIHSNSLCTATYVVMHKNVPHKASLSAPHCRHTKSLK